MRSIDSWLDRFVYKHPRFGIPNLMYVFIAGTVLVYGLDLVTGNSVSTMLDFYPSAILSGQIWRLVTFAFVPQTYKLLWFFVAMMFYAFLGPYMEREWGTGKFTLFYLCGMGLSVVFGFIAYFISGMGYVPTASMGYVHQSLFLAFATLYPEAPMRFYFIIPVKAKWLAVFYVFMLFFDIMNTPTYLLPIVLPMLLPSLLASLVNYALFFWSDLSGLLGRQRQLARHQTSSQTIHFKSAVKQQQKKEAEQGYRHKCAVCGRTDADYPDLQFRYCSRCAGYHCFCEDHIFNHEHFTQP